MKNILFILFLIAASWKLFGGGSPVELGPGVFVDNAPLQQSIKQAKSFDFKEYDITPLANFTITAKVLSKTNYSLGREADLSPTDLALGWQNMSDEAVLKDISISQSNRWYYWKVQDFPIPRREIETQSANMHLIPADDAIESMISSTREGQIVEFSGYLVRVDADSGWHWQSSLTRDDTGAHACEVIFVKDYQIIR